MLSDNNIAVQRLAAAETQASETETAQTSRAADPLWTSFAAMAFERTKLYSDEAQGNDEEKSSCAVCLAEFEESDVVLELACRHVYHQCCLVQWMERSTVCPCCRRTVSAHEVTTPTSADHPEAPEPRVVQRLLERQQIQWTREQRTTLEFPSLRALQAEVEITLQAPSIDMMASRALGMLSVDDITLPAIFRAWVEDGEPERSMRRNESLQSASGSNSSSSSTSSSRSGTSTSSSSSSSERSDENNTENSENESEP